MSDLFAIDDLFAVGIGLDIALPGQLLPSSGGERHALAIVRPTLSESVDVVRLHPIRGAADDAPFTPPSEGALAEGGLGPPELRAGWRFERGRWAGQ